LHKDILERHDLRREPRSAGTVGRKGGRDAPGSEKIVKGEITDQKRKRILGGGGLIRVKGGEVVG